MPLLHQTFHHSSTSTTALSRSRACNESRLLVSESDRSSSSSSAACRHAPRLPAVVEPSFGLWRFSSCFPAAQQPAFRRATVASAHLRESGTMAARLVLQLVVMGFLLHHAAAGTDHFILQRWWNSIAAAWHPWAAKLAAPVAPAPTPAPAAPAAAAGGDTDRLGSSCLQGAALDDDDATSAAAEAAAPFRRSVDDLTASSSCC